MLRLLLFWRLLSLLFLPLAPLAALGCRSGQGGAADAGDGGDLAPAEAGDGPGSEVGAGDGAGEDTLPADRPLPPPLLREPPPGASGAPAVVGCADGTREGFDDPAAWTAIAGCSGAWSVPGVRSPWSRAPQCGRAAGNTGANPAGVGCAVADLCAPGWHVCEDAEDVRRSSPTECESAVASGYAAFFVARVGATAYGLCAADASFDNDLHGCGSFGQPEAPGCQPLDRRLGFTDCLASQSPPGVGAPTDPARDGRWSCGDADQHLEEANLVTKTGPGLGGVLCCRDGG